MDGLKRWLSGIAPLDIGVIAALAVMAKSTEALDLFHIVFLLLAVEAFFLTRTSFWIRLVLLFGLTEFLIARAGEPAWQDLAEPVVLATIAGLVFAMHDSRDRARSQLRYQATHDALTDLLNLRALQTRLDALMSPRTKEPFAVLYIDLDGFKRVNDEHGHDIGDGVLSAAARRVERAVRDGDAVGRIGGDEFAVLLYPADREVAESVARRLVDELKSPFAIDEVAVTVSASIGIAMSVDVPAVTRKDFIGAADRAMYSVKRDSKSAYAFAPPAEV